MSERPDRTTSMVATAVGVVGIAGAVALVVFSVVGEPFGTINDLAGAATGVLGGALSWRLRSRTGTPLAALAAAGGALSVLGSYLVVSKTTGFLLAGFVSAVAFGLIGPSVAAAALRDRSDGATPRSVANFGIATGALMTVGLVGVLPAAMRIDDFATAPAWSWLAFIGSIGTFLYPFWALVAARQWRRVEAEATELSESA